MSRRTNLNTVRTDFNWNSFWSHDKVYTQVLWYDIKINEYLTGIFYSLKIPTSKYIIRRFFNNIVMIETDLWIFERDRFARFVPNKFYYYYLLYRIRKLFRRCKYVHTCNKRSTPSLVWYYIDNKCRVDELVKVLRVKKKKKRLKKVKRGRYSVFTGRRVFDASASYTAWWSKYWMRKIRLAISRNDLSTAYYWYNIESNISEFKRKSESESESKYKYISSSKKKYVVATRAVRFVHFKKHAGRSRMVKRYTRTKRIKRDPLQFRYKYFFISIRVFQARCHSILKRHIPNIWYRNRRAFVKKIARKFLKKVRFLRRQARLLKYAYSRRLRWHVYTIYRVLMLYASVYSRNKIIRTLNKHLLSWLHSRRLNA